MSAEELEQLNQAKLDELRQMVINLLAEAKRQADSAPDRSFCEEQYLAALRGERDDEWAVAVRFHARIQVVAQAAGLATQELDIFP